MRRSSQRWSWSVICAASLVCAAAAVLVTACGDMQGRGTSKDGTGFPGIAADDFRRVPPAVESATVQPLGADAGAGDNKALLEVRFDQTDQRVGKSVPIFPEGKEVRLRDDGTNGDVTSGDGVFSAIIDFDPRELTDLAASAAREVNNIKPRAIFRGRQIIGIEDPEFLRDRIQQVTALRDANTLIRDKAKIDISLFLPFWSYLRIDPARSLMITDPSVVQDPSRTFDPCNPSSGAANGAWTFKHLVTEMVAGTGVTPEDFVERWLQLWQSNQTVSSGFIASPRPNVGPKILNQWPRKLINGQQKLDLDQSPFRLSAIVNRIDLAQNLIYGPGSGGEGRFVFGVRDRSLPGCQFMPFSVIFEYGIPKRGCHELKDWAKQWAALSSLPIGSPQYNAALEAITEQFVKANATPGNPNGSALNQLRTNENALNSLWELREFKINRNSHLLLEDTVKQTPDKTLNNGAAVGSFINANEVKILQDRHVVPDKFPGTSRFMAATSRAEGTGALNPQLQTFFQGSGVTNNDARFHFSLNTCTACHIRETGTVGLPTPNTRFLHVDPQQMPAKLSRFLTGASVDVTDFPDEFQVSDPVDGSARFFNDLDQRRQRLANIADGPCINVIFVPPRQLIDRIPRIGPDGRLPRIRDARIEGLINDPIRMVH